MRALSVEELGFVAGGQGLPKPAVPQPRDVPPLPGDLQRQLELIVVEARRRSDTLGLVVRPGPIGGGVMVEGSSGESAVGVSIGTPGGDVSVGSTVPSADNPVQVEINLTSITVWWRNATEEERRKFWGRAFGTPREAIN